VLDLEAGVHLQEVEVAGPGLEQELDGAGVLVVGDAGDVAGRLAEGGPDLAGQPWRRRLLDQLLVAALQ
jgi:hypothetical protein